MQTNKPKIISSFEASMLALFAGIVFVIFLGVSGLGVHHLKTEAASTPTASQTETATATAVLAK